MGMHFAPPPPAAISRVLASFNREQLAGFITVAIDLLDLADGDPESEEPNLEDSFTSHQADGPGCPIADAGGVALGRDATEDDEDDDPAEDSDDDRCPAGDDTMIGGAIMMLDHWGRERLWRPGDDDDAEASCPPAYQIDQSKPLFANATNDL
jgi:hypothetical protein